MLLLLLGLACGPTGQPPDKTGDDPIAVVDADGDGHDIDHDCDDNDGDVYPGAEDAPYDGVDADCAGDSDFDADGDGFDQGEGRRDDCDDTDAAVNPDAEEHCDEVDEDRDGEADNDPVDGATWYQDRDGDGYAGDRDTLACSAPGDAWSRTSSDCDDTDAAVHPGAAEIPCSGADEDCDGAYGVGGAIGPDGSVYTQVGAAVAAAADGETVTVCEGTVTESVVLDHPVHLAGLVGAAISAADGGAPLVFLADASAADLVLSDGTGYLDGTATFGGLVYVDAGVRAELEGIEASGGDAWGGGCVFVGVGATLEARATTVTGCSGADLGGVLYAQDGASLLLEDVSLGDAEAGDAGGVLFLGEGGVAELVATTLQEGDAQLGGGAYLAAGATLVADADSYVEDNTGDYGAGLFLSQGASWTGAVLRRNDARSDGGGVYIPDGETEMILTDTVISAGEAVHGGGIAVYGEVTLVDVTVNANSASTSGGGLYLLDGAITMEGGACTRNESLVWGAGAALWGGSRDSAFLEVSHADFGTGGSDNDGDDVYTFSTSGSDTATYGSDASFTCTSRSGC